MKKVILNIAGLMFSFLAFAQTTERSNESSYPKVSKGYYSIGNNAQKLNNLGVTTIIASEPAAPASVNKGYYSLETNRRKANRQKTVIQSSANTRAVPVVTKGYYSIGNNAQKLQK